MLGPYLLGPNNTPENGIYTGDARELAKAIPDESVDLVFTDPVFSDISAYGWLAAEAIRILQVGGNLIAESGKYHLPEILAAMMPSGLTWQSMLAEVYPMAWARVNVSKTMAGWGPYLWFSKGARSGPWMFDRYHANGPDKSHHKWGDNPGFFTLYIGYLSEPGGVIFDPFTGGGTVPVVCHHLGRRYLAFEIDPDVAQRARDRVRDMQPPLFVPEPEQPALFAGVKVAT